MKKAFLILLLILLCLPCCSGTKNTENILYEVLDDGNAIITQWSDDDPVITIPAELDGHSVTAISENAFMQNFSVKIVKIPATVTNIEANPFFLCSYLEEIQCDKNNHNFKTENGVLFSKDGQTLVAYPAQRDARTYVIPEDVRTIGPAAFSHATNLEEIKLPENLSLIMDGAFTNCTGIRTLEIPDSVSKIGSYAFNSCVGLNYVKLPDSLSTVEEGLFTDSALTKIIIPDGVKEINHHAFTRNFGLGYIYIPDSVVSIASDAFENCWYPRLILSDNDTIRSFAEENGISCNDGEYTYKLNSDGDAIVTGYIGNDTKIKLPEIIRGHNVVGIGYAAFIDLNTIEEVEIPDSITEISTSAFLRCNNLSKVNIPNALTEINSGVFQECNLNSVIIPESVHIIHRNAFDSKTELILIRSSREGH